MRPSTSAASTPRAAPGLWSCCSSRTASVHTHAAAVACTATRAGGRVCSFRTAATTIASRGRSTVAPCAAAAASAASESGVAPWTVAEPRRTRNRTPDAGCVPDSDTRHSTPPLPLPPPPRAAATAAAAAADAVLHSARSADAACSTSFTCSRPPVPLLSAASTNTHGNSRRLSRPARRRSADTTGRYSFHTRRCSHPSTFSLPPFSSIPDSAKQLRRRWIRRGDRLSGPQGPGAGTGAGGRRCRPGRTTVPRILAANQVAQHGVHRGDGREPERVELVCAVRDVPHAHTRPVYLLDPVLCCRSLQRRALRVALQQRREPVNETASDGGNRRRSLVGRLQQLQQHLRRRHAACSAGGGAGGG
eukprot:Rhum_TRINITY_DN14676_c6_g1::Rhum_TRINITY_DN14676_c6_g1_i1::g.108579::m.108579